MPRIPHSLAAASTSRAAIATFRQVATTSTRHTSRALRSSARLQQRDDQAGSAVTQGEEGELDPNSLQARMIKALEERYTPPATPPPPRPFAKAAPPPPPTTPALAQEAVSQVVAESLAQAEQVGAAQAAVAADAPPPRQPSTSSLGPSPTDSSSVTAEVHVPALGTFEDGRFLPKTPEGKPWAAQYIRPAHAGTRGGEGAEGSGSPAVYYGKLLQAGASGSSMKSTSQRLKDLGVNPASLPLDDAKAMRAVREGIRRFEKAGRVYGAKYGALQYRTRKLTATEIELFQAEIEAESARSRERRRLEGEEEDQHEGGFSTTMSRNLPDSVDSSRAPGGGGGGRGGGMSVRRWTSIADERIEAARAAGFFKENKLRGKPLLQDIEERNPYIGKEEFLMNRMVKRQGASPPWVELNHTFYTHLDQFRNKIVDSYSRKAVRALTQSGALSSSDGPGTGTSGTDEQRRSYFLSLAKSFRDGGEWQSIERGYHEESIKDMNNTLKRHNFLCPPSARRGMLTREEELQKCYDQSIQVIAQGLEETWEEMTGRKARKGSESAFAPAGAFGSPSSATFDIWGNPIEDDNVNGSAGGRKGWGLGSLFSKADNEGSALERTGSGGGDGEDGIVNKGLADEDGRPRQRGAKDDVTPFLGEGIVKKIKAWLVPARSSSSSRDNEVRR
ncbi:hypothetical protein BCV69DRAFT_13701 [Microstroma glucosiphilum]|uniref:DnaJ homologue subfamily C member 28 conserved domain-containing protein n=1 Tax=Pseudomicrostroma glucosiphilum TaxID=1684307 RepID=A0A316UG83_9BASI|nr:hypothetical protein BCV69DRAFT_13701 [Pseudomicrostroma glucosiphilum]PWN23914.1 hypothetical protein BCV69DRAFT_13701 [Pseudomicrostroma glucosiphilum]